MADTYTPLTDILLMEDGSHNNDWGQQKNSNLTAIENMAKGTRANATTGGTTTLTKTTAREPHQRVTGVLVSNATIEVPAVSSLWLFSNETTGAFTVTVKVTAQTGVVVPQGSSMWLRGNGTDVVAMNTAQPRGTEKSATVVAGTVDAITLTFQPALTKYTPGMELHWTSAGVNTVTNPTINGSGLGVLTIKKGANAALVAGDTGAAGYICKGTINAAGDAIILQSPANVDSAGVTAIVAGKKAIWIDAAAMRPKATNGVDFSDYDSGSNDLTLRCADFDPTTQQYGQFKMAMPTIWNEGTVTFKPYWTNTGGASTETVVFSLAGAAFSNDEGINGTAFGTVQTSTDTWLAQNDLHIGPESSAITIAGTPAAGDLVVFEVSRVVGSDNMAGDARLLGLMLYVTIDAFNEA